MAKSYQALDPSAILSQFAYGDIRGLLSTSSGDYADEEYTIAYIESLFKSIDSVAEFLMSLANQIRSYVVTFDSVEPPPFETYLQEVAFLDRNGTVIGTVSGSTETLNIRSEPSTQSTKVGNIPSGQEVVIEDYVTNDNGQVWAKIKQEDGGDAYALKDYIEVDLGQNSDSSEATE